MYETTQPDHLDNILHRALPGLDSAYLATLAGGMAEPTFLVLDLRDEHARALAGRCPGCVPLGEFVAGARRRGKRPNLVIALDRGTAIEVLAGTCPGLVSDLAAPCVAGGYLAVVIASGTVKVAEVRPPGPDGPEGPEQAEGTGPRA